MNKSCLKLEKDWPGFMVKIEDIPVNYFWCMETAVLMGKRQAGPNSSSDASERHRWYLRGHNRITSPVYWEGSLRLTHPHF